MTWERALEADARLAARNSVLIRAALRQTVDFEGVFRGYQATNPNENLTLPQQRSRARAWAIINVRVNLEAFKEVIYRTWAAAYVLGDLAAQEQLELMEQAQKADVKVGIDWSKWKPGDAVSALILKPPKAFQRLLESQGIVWKAFSDTTLRDIGNSIGEAIELGLSAKQSAKLIMNHVASPARALSIAITEQNRAISQAAKERYLQANVETWQWLTFDPCKICAQNDRVIVQINQPYPSGHTQTPAHPNCRCALRPISKYSDAAQLPGATNVVPPSIPTVSIPLPDPTPAIETVVTEAVAPGFAMGKWKRVERSAVKEEIVDRIHRLNPRFSREEIERYVDSPRLNSTDRQILKTGIILQNGNVSVRFYGPGAKITDANKKKVLKQVEKLQKANPKAKVNINVGNTSKRKYGWAERGGESLWITPKVAGENDPLPSEIGFKMPSISEVPHRDYVLAHEWGHLIEMRPDAESTMRKLRNQFPDAFRSGYSKKNDHELYAELFAEWFMTEGKTDNALVQATAKEFGWGIQMKDAM